MASKQNYLPTWTTVTPVKPKEKQTTVMPILPPIVGPKLSTPILPPLVDTKTTTPILPPVSKKTETPVKPLNRIVVKADSEQQSKQTFDTVRQYYYDSMSVPGRNAEAEIERTRKAHENAVKYLEGPAPAEIKRVYQRTLSQYLSRLPSQKDKQQLRSTLSRRAALETLGDATRAIHLGFSKENLGVSSNVMDSLVRVALTTTQGNTIDVVRNALSSMTPSQQETVASLANEWTGTFDDLVFTAKHL